MRENVNVAARKIPENLEVDPQYVMKKDAPNKATS